MRTETRGPALTVAISPVYLHTRRLLAPYLHANRAASIDALTSPVGPWYTSTATSSGEREPSTTSADTRTGSPLHLVRRFEVNGFDGYIGPRRTHSIFPRSEPVSPSEIVVRELSSELDGGHVKPGRVLTHHPRRIESRHELRNRVLHASNPASRQSANHLERRIAAHSCSSRS